MITPQHNTPQILFFSRGQGRGHALPDLAISEALLQEKPQLDLHFVSYGTGADTLRAHGQTITDLDLPDDNPFIETLVRCLRVLKERKTSLVVTHEEFAAIVAAKAFNVPSVFLSDWFPRAGTFWFECVANATEVIFLDDAGYCDEPPEVTGKVTYTGTVLRRFSVADQKKEMLKQSHLALPAGTMVVLVLPGGAAASLEANAPLMDLVVGAFDLLHQPQKALIWVAGTDASALKAKFANRDDIFVMPPHIDIERTMLAGDVAITKANRITTLELSALGVPSISISYGINPIDDSRVARIPTNEPLRARGLTPAILGDRITAAYDRGHFLSKVGDNAKHIHAAVTKLLSILESVQGHGKT